MSMKEGGKELEYVTYLTYICPSLNNTVEYFRDSTGEHLSCEGMYLPSTPMISC